MHMVNDIAGASCGRPSGGWARMLLLEGVLGSRRSLDPAMPIARDRGRGGTSGMVVSFVGAGVGRRVA
jgi:hypothetical protein